MRRIMSAARPQTQTGSLVKRLPRLAAVLVLALAGSLFASMSAAATERPQFVRITQGGDAATSERLAMALSKATIVELPKAASDVLVSDPEVVDAIIRTPHRTYLLGKKVGQTNAFFFDAAGKQILNLEITVERDLAPLASMLTRFLPDARLEVSALNDNIVLSGSVPNASAADRARQIASRFIGDEAKVLSMVSIEGNEQVMLRVRIVEMQRTVLKQLGVDLDTVFSSGNVVFDVATQNPLSLVGRSLGGLGTTGSNGNLRYNLNGSGTEYVDGLIRAFERHGLVRTLAEPNLTAISGEAASFLAGGEFPVPSARDRNGNVSIEFKPFGVGLGFTPVVMSEGRISLKISTEVSELTTEGAFQLEENTVQVDENTTATVAGVTIPALTVRRTATTVELPSGGSLVIAGLIQESTKQNIDGIPGAKDLPVLGSLFRSRDFRNNETELVVIVTPYLVDPVAEHELTTPADGFAPASDLETFVLGRLNAVYGVQGGEAPSGKPPGTYGFVVE